MIAASFNRLQVRLHLCRRIGHVCFADSAPLQSRADIGNSMKNKLTALRTRLLDAQRKIIINAAEAGAAPSDNALRKIADLEVAIAAVEAQLEQSK